MRARASIAAAAVLAGLLVASPAASAQTAGEWSDGWTGRGTVFVEANRRDLGACDDTNDRTRAGLKYRTTIGRTLILQAPQDGCVFDRVWFGVVDHAKFCWATADLTDRTTFPSCNEENALQE